MNPARRRFLIGASATIMAGTRSISFAKPHKTINIGLTPVILDDRSRFLNKWRQWLETKLHSPVNFIQRPRYRDITKLLLDRTLTAAWICGYPFIRNNENFKLLVQPVYQNKSTYNSLIIAGNTVPEINTLEQFEGKSFIFTDPDSNSGYLYPTYRLREKLSQNPDFFRRSFYSWGHNNSIDAVANSLADGGAVDSYVWDLMMKHNSDYRHLIRIIERSPDFGFPPLVTHRDLPDELHNKLKSVLLSMHLDNSGAALLKKLELDRFGEGTLGDYAGIAEMMNATELSELNISV